jgi:uncharacterized membrane protein YdcZ (DUF606 family)
MRSAVFIAGIVGIGIALQVALVGRFTRSVHPLAISLALQVSGLVAGGVWALTQRTWQSVGTVSLQWWWLPLGALGWVVVGALGYASATLGVSTTLAIAIAAQLAAGLVFDVLTGEVDLSLRQPMGAGLLLVGVILITTRT